MNFLDYDFDEEKYIITIEATHEELFHICTSLEFSTHALISDYDKSIMLCFHDFIFNIISRNK